MKSVLIYQPHSISASAQDIKEFFTNKDAKVTWRGIDFSHLRMIGVGNVTASDIKYRYCEGINNVVNQETNKYVLEKTFRKNAINRYLMTTSKANEMIDTNNLIVSKAEQKDLIPSDSLSEIVRSYDFADRHGIGVMLIGRDINKNKDDASIYFRVINMDEHKLLFSELLEEGGSGFGFKNHWAHGVLVVLDGISYKMTG